MAFRPNLQHGYLAMSTRNIPEVTSPVNFRRQTEGSLMKRMFIFLWRFPLAKDHVGFPSAVRKRLLLLFFFFFFFFLKYEVEKMLGIAAVVMFTGSL